MTCAGIAVLLVAPLALPAGASQETSHWTANSRQLRIEDRTGDPRWRVAAIRAVGVWNAAAAANGANIHLTYTSTGSYPGDCTYKDTTVSICRHDLTSALAGQTWVAADAANRMTGAFIYVSAYEVFTDQTQQALMCHELGHALGLNHSADQYGSCMYRNIGPMGPDNNDLYWVRTLYGPGTS